MMGCRCEFHPCNNGWGWVGLPNSKQRSLGSKHSSSPSIKELHDLVLCLLVILLQGTRLRSKLNEPPETKTLFESSIWTSHRKR